MMLGHWQGSHDDGDAPLWTRSMIPNHTYRFRQPRSFMARLVAGLTDIWVGDVVGVRILLHLFHHHSNIWQLTISPRMIDWAYANSVSFCSFPFYCVLICL